MSWLSDLDPEWITAGVATVVGTGSLIGLGIAVQTFRENVRERKVAVARLVWAEVTKQWTLERDAEIPLRELSYDKWAVWDRDATHHGDRMTVNQHSVVLLTKISNASAEPVGKMRLKFRDAQRNELKHPAFSLDVMHPGFSVVACVVLPVAHAKQTVWSLHYPTVLFRDSAGHNWQREATDPPIKAEKAPRSLRRKIKKSQRAHQKQERAKEKAKRKRKQAREKRMRQVRPPS